MPVATHFKFVFRGEFISTPEQWSMSMKFSRDNPAGADASYGDINQGSVDTAVAAFFAGGRFNNRVRCTGWRAYQIGTDGLTEGNPLITEYERALDGSTCPVPLSHCRAIYVSAPPTLSTTPSTAPPSPSR